LLELRNRDKIRGGSCWRRDAANQRTEGGAIISARPKLLCAASTRILKKTDTNREEHRCDGDVGDPHGDQVPIDQEAEQTRSARTDAHSTDTSAAYRVPTA
jgi:hypothetical protein